MDVGSAWANYVKRLGQLDSEATKKVGEFIGRTPGFSFADPDDMNKLVRYAYGISSEYGEGAAALACEMYDAIGIASGQILPPAEPADLPQMDEVAKAVRGTAKTGIAKNVARSVGRLVKRTGADTTLKNAIRDGAEFAWIPNGDTCAFCITLASRGWQKASAKALKRGHAEHIHANCDCTYGVQFNGKPTYKNYDPGKYEDMYYGAEGSTPNERINSIRRMKYQENKDRINAQKRAAYAARKAMEQEKGSRINSYSVNQAITGTKEYRDKYLSITPYEEVNSKLYDKALDILDHRNGTDYEDMHLISTKDGLVKGSQTKVEYYTKVSEDLRHSHVWYNKDLNSAIKNNPSRTLISIHNHPESLPPSGGDFQSQFDHGYKGGVIACHNGDVYYYKVGKKKFTGILYDMTVDKYKKQGYSELEAYGLTLEQFSSDYGIVWRKL